MSNQIPKKAVYIIDDDDAVRDSLDTFLTMKGMNVATFSSGKAMFDSDRVEPDLVILDVNMPDSDGFTVLRQLRERNWSAPVILISGLGDSELRSRSERAGVVAFFDKPIDSLALCQKITTLLQDRPTAAT